MQITIMIVTLRLIFGAGNRNRTCLLYLEGSRCANQLYPHLHKSSLGRMEHSAVSMPGVFKSSCPYILPQRSYRASPRNVLWYLNGKDL